MYESFFGLQETAFSIAPNPHYLYMSKQHNEALAHLIYAVGREGGFVLLTGEVGTGKTTICRCFLEQVPEDTDVAFILNPKLSPDELLKSICDELGVPYIGDEMAIKDFVDFINEKLLRSHAQGRHTVLIIDEAQNLSADVLEQLRLLTNLETHEKKLLQIVLLGQPELQDMFQQKQLRQLAQRVTARFHLQALNEQELAGYVQHRLNVAGATDPGSIFPAKTLRALFKITEGIPRITNLICDRAMLGAYTQSKRQVDPTMLKQAADEVLGQNRQQVERRQWLQALAKNQWLRMISLAVVTGLSAGIGAWLVASLMENKVVQPVVAQAEVNPAAQAESADAKTSAAVAKARPVTDTAMPAANRPTDPASSTLSALADNSGKTTKPAAVPQSAKTELQKSLPEPDRQATSAPLDLDELLRANQTDLTRPNAYGALMHAWNVRYDVRTNGSACDYARRFGLSCLNKVGSLGTLRHMGLPAVLTLYMTDGSKRYALLRGLNDDRARFVMGKHLVEIPVDQLDRIWRGHFAVLWKVPPSYRGPLKPGTIGPMSKWISQQLDIYEGNPDALPGGAYYDRIMAGRVRDFQRSVGEVPDGIVGINTLIQLSKLTQADIPLLNDTRKESL